MRDHALLAPSSANRWLVCTPSARLEEKMYIDGDELLPTNSSYADEGTFAHELAELLLREALGVISTQWARTQIAVMQANQYYNEEMFDHCFAYAQYVVTKYEEIKQKCKDAIIHVETRIDLSLFIPQSWGHLDAAIIADGTLYVFDFKYGSGTAVSAVENPQMRLYAFGAFTRYEILYDIYDVEMCIYQPRLESITTYAQTITSLRDWIISISDIAQRAHDGIGELVPGDHCKFCKYSVRCPALHDMRLSIAKYEFRLPDDLTDGEIVQVLKDADTIKTWLTHVQEYALEQAIKRGYNWPGYKVVQGRSKRVYANEDKLIEKLSEKYTTDQFLKPKQLLGFGALEKSIGKNAFKKIVEPFLVKPQGAPTLVPESDNRPALNSHEQAVLDFKNADNE